MNLLPGVAFCVILLLCKISDALILFPQFPLLRDLRAKNVENNEQSKNDEILLPEDCGNVRATWRVENYVRQTEFYEFPFYVELIYENYNKDNISSSFGCGGTLINNRHVVTAASCIVSKPKLIAVRLGDHDRNTDPDCYKFFTDRIICAPPHVEFKVSTENIIVHKLYNNSLTYDIALIRLPKPVEYTDAIEPVCLPIKPKYRDQGNLTLIGFPQTNENAARSNTLLSLAIPHLSNPVCQTVLNNIIPDDYLCAAGRSHKTYCHGYGGSGILYVIAEEYRLRWVLAAIVPYGMSICNPNDVPNIFSRVNMHNQWILQNINVSI